MRKHFPIWLLRVALFAVLLQAYVPAGFMPAKGLPFALELCPGATVLPPTVGHEHHDHHPGAGTHERGDAPCPFGCAPSAGPALQVSVAPPAPAAVAVAASPACVSGHSRVIARAQLPRGPPLLASS